MYSVIDIGSNTVRLVIYQVEEDGRIRPMLNNKRAAGLAGYVDAEGSMRRDGVERLIAILQEMRAYLTPEEKELQAMTSSVLNRLYGMTEAEFEELDLYADL